MTIIEDLIAFVESAEIEPNKIMRSTLEKLLVKRGLLPTENASSTVREQQTNADKHA